MNIINVVKKGNTLEIKGGYTPIVCGTSNNYIVFEFDESDKAVIWKTALFELKDIIYSVKFQGNELRVPVLPNESMVKLSLITHTKRTNEIKLRLEPSMLGKF